MSERDQRKSVVRTLRPLGAFAVENPVLPGTPDVAIIPGWVELKWLRALPANEDTPVRLDHWTPQQKVWHFRWRRAGGQSWVLIQCRREWILMDGAVAAMTLGHKTWAELIARSTAYWRSGLRAKELIDLLQQGQEPYAFTPHEIMHMRERR